MLNQNQEKCIELMVKTDMKQVDIAEELGVTPTTICLWKKQEEFKTAYADAVRAAMPEAAPKAWNTIVDLLKSNNAGIRLAAARDILDRAGFKAEDRLKISGLEGEKTKLDSLIAQITTDKDE